MVFQQGALLAMFPIEEWLQQLQRAETLAPILDPTLYRDYIYSGRDELIRELLEGALAFKRAVVKAQEKIKENPTLGEPHPRYRAGAQ